MALRFGFWTSEPLRACPWLPNGSPLFSVLYLHSNDGTNSVYGIGRILTFVDNNRIYRTGVDRQEASTQICRKHFIANPSGVSGVLALRSIPQSCECSLNNSIGKTDLPKITLNEQSVQQKDRIKYPVLRIKGYGRDRLLGSGIAP